MTVNGTLTKIAFSQIYDDREILGRYCSPDDQPVITTTENVLYVDLKSDTVNNEDFEFHAFYATTGNKICLIHVGLSCLLYDIERYYRNVL